jgi:hypothetical protein
MHIPALILFVLALTGCATSSTIQPVSSSKSQFDGAVYGGQLNVVNDDKSGSEQFRIFHQASTGFVSVQSVRESAEQRASEFCDKKGKVNKTLSEQTSTPPYILGNFPRIEIIFACVDKPALAPSSSLIDNKYTKLTNLKKLLDDDVITKEEFDKEKTKILNQQ